MAGAEKSAVEAQTRDRTGTVQGPQRGQRAQSRGRRLGRPDDKAGPCRRGAKWWAVVTAGLMLLGLGAIDLTVPGAKVRLQGGWERSENQNLNLGPGRCRQCVDSVCVDLLTDSKWVELS